MASEKTAIVFGGTGTVGSAICRALTADGARVGFTYHQNEDVAAKLVRELPNAVMRRVDLSSLTSTQQAFRSLREELGRLDAFVHAATLTSAAVETKFETLAEADEAAFDRMFAVNVKSAYFVCRELSAGFSGNIVLLGSIDSTKTLPAPVAYAASKGALSGLARAAAKELGRGGVKINVVAPGVLEAGSSRTLSADLRAEYLKHCGLRRFGKIEEVSELVSWLALENSYVTGQTLVVDGAL